MANILIIDDEKDIRDLLHDILEDEGHSSDTAGHAQSALDLVERNEYDLVILDIWLKESHMDGIDILKYLKNRLSHLPVVIISGHGNVEIAVAAIKQGAFDFIEKPFNIDHLNVVVNRALELSKLRKQNLRGTTIKEHKLIGDSQVMRALIQKLDKVAKTQSRVMLHGPAGSGKEVAARFLHAHSDRASKPFIVVNSALMEAEELERQLFGYEEEGKVFQGILERANGGVVFFDEIADMPFASQGKILRIINDQAFERIGSSQLISVDIRLISATKCNLKALIDEGKFREELYHRLAVVPIEIPPLSARLDDMPALVEHFVHKLSEESNLAKIKFSEEAISVLQVQSWTGNLRELRNTIERVLILNGEAKEISVNMVRDIESSGDNAAFSSDYLFLPLREARELFEQRYLTEQIQRFQGNVTRTSNFIGMERSALHRKMKSLNIVGHQGENK